MKHCSNCGTVVNDNANFCEKCGYSFSGNNSQVNSQNDAPSGGFAILSFFFPLVGLILWLAFSKSPQKAKSCKKGTIAGFITGVVLFVIIIILAPVFLTAYNISNNDTVGRDNNYNFSTDNGNNQSSAEYSGIGLIIAKTKDGHSVFAEIVLGYDPNNRSTLSELRSRDNQLDEFFRVFFLSKNASELAFDQEPKIKDEIKEKINGEILNNGEIQTVIIKKLDVMRY